MKTVYPNEVSVSNFHGLMLGAVAPRPIAFVSSVSADGNVNLSPYSFFNAFSSNPPTLIFSPARRVRDNTTKHTFENAKATGEVVVNIVDYSMVEQMSLSSTEYDEGVNEFVKAGLTQVPSEKVKPPRVKEAPVSFECKVQKIIELGAEGGAGNLIICEIAVGHFQDHIFDANGKIDPFKLDAVARAGGNWYVRANAESLFEIEKPIRAKGIGIDRLPTFIVQSTVLTGNNLAQLANVEQIPDQKTLSNIDLNTTKKSFSSSHHEAKFYLDHRVENAVLKAWKILLSKAE